MSTVAKDLQGVPDIPERKSNILQMPTGRHYAADVHAGDVTMPGTFNNCRYVYSDTDGLCKFTYQDPSDGEEYTEVKQFQAGVMYPIRNIVKIHRYTDESTTECTTQIYLNTGSSVIGLKVRR